MKKLLLLILILPVIVQAADTELQDLDELTAIVGTDVLYVVDDPGGTPVSKKITAANIFDLINTYALLNAIMADFTLTHNGLFDTFSELNVIVANKTLVNEEDAVAWDALGTFGLGITITTGDPFILGTTRWDNGSDLMDGERIANDTIDDDSIDWADCTFDDFDFETNWRMWHSNGAGDVTELTLGANGTFLESNGAAAAPAFRTLASGDIPDISGTYEVQLVNEAGLYSVLSDVTNFLQSTDIDSVGELAGITDYETGSGALVFGTAPTFTTSIQLTGADADPAAAAGTVVYDNTITGIMSGGGLRWYDDNSVRLIVDLETDPSDDDYVVAYDSTADGFYMKVDAGAAGGDEWGDAVDSDILPTDNDNIYDLGSVAASFKDGYFQGTLEAGTLTEGGNAVYNSSETPGGSLGGSWAAPTIDDLFIKLGGDTITAGTYDFTAATLTMPKRTKNDDRFYLFNAWNPNALYDTDTQICFEPNLPANITITEVTITLDADPTTELDWDLKWADAFIGLGTATLIVAIDTTNGTTDVDSGWNDATVVAGKCLYIEMAADPDSNIKQAIVKIRYDFD